MSNLQFSAGFLITSDRMISAMSAEAIRSDWVGQVIDGRFTLLEWLGGSERTGVFLTELPGPQGRKAAIKLIHVDADEVEAHTAGWAATRPISHPHLMRLLQTGRCEWGDGILLYSVAEYAEEVLSEILPERALKPDEAREMLGPVLDALTYLHGKGLVHGHLKPSNIMVVDDKLKLSGDSLQVAGEIGKPLPVKSIYEASERAEGIVSPGGDLWSLGVTLVEALTQHPPAWDKSTDEDPAVPKSIPQPYAGIARGCMRADPMGRCTLDNVKNWLGSGQPPKEPIGKTEKETPRKSPATALVAAVLVMVAAVSVIVWRSHNSQPPAPIAAASSDAGQQPVAAKTTPEAKTQEQPQEQPAAAPPDSQAQEQEAPAAAPPTPQAQAPVQEQAPAAAQTPPPQAQPAASQSAGNSALSGPGTNSAVAQQVMPDVQPKALSSIHGGFAVRIRVTVDAAGNVSDAAFDSEGPSKYFANAAMKAAQQSKFKPGQAGSWMLQYRFTQDGAEVTTAAAH
jgi:serine/threonine-protein kinase